MSIFNESRDLIVKTLESIGKSADKMAINAKYKAKEMSLESNKRELLNKLSNESYKLWQQGVEFPLDIVKILKDIKEIDEKISDIKAEHFAYIDPNIEKDFKKESDSTDSDNNSNI